MLIQKKDWIIKIKKYDLLTISYIFLSYLFFLLVAKGDIINATDSINGSVIYRFYADHPTYVEYFRNLNDNPWAFLLLKPNFFGPFLILYVVGDDLNAIFFFNTVCLLVGIKLIQAFVDVDRYKYTVFILINPITFISLFSVNKEIVTLVAMNLFIVYLSNNNKKMLIMAILVGIIARKELSLLFITYFLINLLIKNWHERLYLLSSILLIIVTLSGFLINSIFSAISEYSTEVEITVTNSGSGGTILLLNQIQEKYGYIWVFLPKTLLNLVGDVLSRTSNLFYFQDVYTDIIVWGQSCLFLYFLPRSAYAFIKNKSLLCKKLVFVFLLTCILFSYIPVVQNRYFYAAYPLLITAICLRMTNNSVHESGNTDLETNQLM